MEESHSCDTKYYEGVYVVHPVAAAYKTVDSVNSVNTSFVLFTLIPSFVPRQATLDLDRWVLTQVDSTKLGAATDQAVTPHLQLLITRHDQGTCIIYVKVHV